MAEFLLNRSPCRSNPGWRTPFELFFSKVPDGSRIYVPGYCAACVHVDKPKREDPKLGERAVSRVLMGYGSNGCSFFHPIEFKSTRSCNFRVLEDRDYEFVAKKLAVNEETENSPSLDPYLDHSYACSYVS